MMRPFRSLPVVTPVSTLIAMLAIAGTARAQAPTPQPPPAEAPPPQPGYAEPAAPPPPGYAPPPAGYTPPPPGYAPPPPGYAQPPPAYPPPPPYGYQQPPGVATHPRSGALFMPYLGVNSFQGDTGNNTDPGLRIGGLGGGHVNELLSLNGEVTIDFVNPKNVPSGVDESIIELDLAFSPLLHAAPAPNFELVIGPKLGFWFGAAEATSGGMTAKSSAQGWLLGINGGAFFTVSPSVSIGGLISFVTRNLTKVCNTLPGFAEQCMTDNLGDADKVLGFTGAVLF